MSSPGRKWPAISRRGFLRGGAAAMGIGLPAAGLAGCCALAAQSTQPAAPATGLLCDDAFLAHDPGEGHVECPQRLTAIHEAIQAAHLKPLRLAPRPATDDELLLCHDRAYLELAQREIASGRRSLSTGDTSVCRESWRTAVLAAGGLMTAVDAVIKGTVRNAFCAVRPPGHHASASRGMGFCILNNVALAARYAQRKHGLGKVLIVDWDVHHGNGTQAIFDADPSVLFFDTHQSPLYPGTGKADDIGQGPARGTKINVPLAAGAGRKEFLDAYESKLLPAADKLKPEMIFISAGFDSRKGDRLGGLTLEDADFAELTRRVMAIADQHARGRIVSTLEGGYTLLGLASAATAHLQTLMAP